VREWAAYCNRGWRASQVATAMPCGPVPASASIAEEASRITRHLLRASYSGIFWRSLKSHGNQSCSSRDRFHLLNVIRARFGAGTRKASEKMAVHRGYGLTGTALAPVALGSPATRPARLRGRELMLADAGGGGLAHELEQDVDALARALGCDEALVAGEGAVDDAHVIARLELRRAIGADDAGLVGTPARPARYQSTPSC